MDAQTTADGPLHLTDACHRPHAGQACHLGLQRGAGFCECHALRGIKKVGIPHVGIRPRIRRLANGELVYRSTVFWTPSDLKLGCISQDTPLLMSHLSRCFVSMPSNQPGFIVLTLELVQRQAEFFHGLKGREP